MREGNYWMGMKLPENSLPVDEAVELLGRVKLHPRFMKLESCRGAIFRILFGGGGSAVGKKHRYVTCFKLLIYHIVESKLINPKRESVYK